MTKKLSGSPAERPRRKAPKLRDGVVKRGSTWSYVVRVRDPETGESRPRWVGGFATEDDAKAARDEARVKARRGEYIDRNTITVAEYLAEWIEGHAVEIKPHTFKGYRDMIRLYITPRIGTLRLQALRPSAITKFYRDLLTNGAKRGGPLAANTVKHVHTVLRKALTDAVLVDELLPNNPAERAKLPRVPSTEPGMVWTPAQLRAFLDTASDHRLFAFFHLAAYTGARRGELLNLRWADVDLDKPQIHITGTAAVIDRQRVEGTTKSGRSRVVSLASTTVKVLKAHRARQDEDRLKVGEAWRGSTYVFTTGWGDPLFPDTPSSLMPKLIETHNKQNPRAQLPHARLHDLRHIHATTLLLAGVPVHVVAARLGHADPAITLRVYAHVIHEQAATAADVFAKAING